MSAAGAKLAALAESDPDVLAELIGLYLTAYGGGAFTALLNAPALPDEPLTFTRAAAARVLAVDLVKEVEGDPAVVLSLTEGVLAGLRGENPDPTIMASHAGRSGS